MGKRGPQPKANGGETVAAHCPHETVEHLDDVVYTRNRKRSFVAAEAIRLGLPLVERMYPAVRASLRKVASASSGNGAAKKTSAKRSAAASRTSRLQTKRATK